MIDKIINEAINKYIKEEMMINEYTNPSDSEVIGSCVNTLEGVYERAIAKGASKNEFSIEMLRNTIGTLRKIQGWFK